MMVSKVNRQLTDLPALKSTKLLTQKVNSPTRQTIHANSRECPLCVHQTRAVGVVGNESRMV